MEWLTSPLDPSALHDVATPIAWHGRLMVLAWALLIPIGILTARFCKVTPRQNWPARLDNPLWWHLHRILQYSGGAVMLVGFGLIAAFAGQTPGTAHATLGYTVLALGLLQFVAGWLRGSKGGPTAPALDGSWRGDHYDMTRRRRFFEAYHKGVGYAAVVLSIAAIFTGLALANAPLWMFLSIAVWWFILLVCFVVLQRRGLAFDTYQAIWGPDTMHPGNAMPSQGWGMTRRFPWTTQQASEGEQKLGQPPAS